MLNALAIVTGVALAGAGIAIVLLTLGDQLVGFSFVGLVCATTGLILVLAGSIHF